MILNHFVGNLPKLKKNLNIIWRENMNASDLFIKALENEGVEYIFGIPGEENLDLLEALRKSDKIKLILTRHEQGAGFMAATYGRLTGKLEYVSLHLDLELLTLLQQLLMHNLVLCHY